MENINPTGNVNQNGFVLPQDLVVKQAYGLVFKDILNSLVNDDNEIDDAFKTDEDKESSSRVSANISGYTEQFVDSFLRSSQGQEILNQLYDKYPIATDINKLEEGINNNKQEKR